MREGLKEVGTTFVISGLEEGIEEGDSGRSEAPRGIQTDAAGKRRQIAPQRGYGIRKAEEAGVAADFADRPQNADGAELLEDVGVTQNGGLKGGGLIVRLVLADDIEDSGNFIFRKARTAQDSGCMRAGVSDVIPVAELFGIFGAVADEDAEIVQPGSGTDDVAVVFKAGSDQLGQTVEAGLMAKFVDGESLFPNEVVKGLKVIHRHEMVVAQNGADWKIVMSVRK